MSRASAPQKNPNPKSALTPVTRKPRNFMTRMNKMIATMVRSIEALYTATRVPASLKAALVALLLLVPAAHAASLLPNGEQTFLDDNGDPLAGGSVYFYIPTTSTPKDTWQDPNQVSLNTNPVVLDSAGRAIIYGSGSYRQVVKDSLGNTIWDQLTADPSGTAASWGGTSGGTANAQTVTAGAFSGNSGQVIWFLAGFTNTSATTLTVGTNSPISIYKDISTGPSPLTGGEIVANNVVGVVYEATAGRFHLIETPGFISTVPVTVASATTTNILGTPNSQIAISGTATITSFGTGVNRAPIFVRATGAFTITYNATSLITPTGENMPVQVGDTFVVVSDASSNARIIQYTRAGGVATTRTATDASNFTIAAAASSNALTISLKTLTGADPSAADPVYLTFRRDVASEGYTTIDRVTSALSVTVSSGSTLGTSNSTAFRFWVVAVNNGGTVALGVVNTLSGTNIMALADYLVKSTTAEGGAGAADSAQVIYTASALTSKRIRLLGYVDYSSGLATAGTYASAPDVIQYYGPGIPLPGDIIQTVRTDTGAVATGTTVIPYDDTIPQSGEGDQYMSQAITPTATANLLQVTTQAALSVSATQNGPAMALFQDANANALAVMAEALDSNATAYPFYLTYSALAGTTSATTFKVRAGPATAATMTFNGVGGARKFGGVMNSFIQVQEIMR